MYKKIYKKLKTINPLQMKTCPAMGKQTRHWHNVRELLLMYILRSEHDPNHQRVL